MATTEVSAARLSGVLFVVCLVSGALLVGFDQITRPMILANQALKTRRALLGVLPPGSVRTDQDPTPGEPAGTTHPFVLDFSDEWDDHSDALLRVLDRDQERSRSLPVYRGYDEAGRVTGFALVCELPDGYSGDIRFILGVRFDPEIQAFRVSGSKILLHKETPGLGANMISVTYEESLLAATERRDPVPFFLARFVGLRREEVLLDKDGHPGAIEALTAATITSRAFVNAVQRVLDACNRKQREFLAADGRGAPGATGEGNSGGTVPSAVGRSDERRG